MRMPIVEGHEHCDRLDYNENNVPLPHDMEPTREEQR